jgi:hypothetical protein
LDNSENIMLGVLSQSSRQQVTDAISAATGYIREKFPFWRECPEADLRAWLCWHWCYGLVAPITNADTGKMVALVVVRLFDEPGGFETAYLHHPAGRICYVELAICETKEALFVAVNSLAERHGVPVQLVFERGVRGLAPKIYLWKKFCQKFGGTDYVKS